MSTIINKVGLEAEVFVTNRKGELVIAESHNLPTDEFCLIGEIRGEPGTNPAETVSNFMKAYWEFVQKAKKKDLLVDLSGGKIISHELYAKVIKMMGSKEWPVCENIYGTDISASNDNIVDKETGKTISHKVSCGLHVHFSSEITDSIEIPATDIYEKLSLPISVGTGLATSLEVYRKTFTANGKDASRKVSVSVHRITKPAIKLFVTKMDELLKKFPVEVKTKYRDPGFYETKTYGFEYRSLPMTEDVYHDLFGIASYAFDLFDEL